jgi:hypothetical protein
MEQNQTTASGDIKYGTPNWNKKKANDIKRLEDQLYKGERRLDELLAHELNQENQNGTKKSNDEQPKRPRTDDTNGETGHKTELVDEGMVIRERCVDIIRSDYLKVTKYFFCTLFTNETCIKSMFKQCTGTMFTRHLKKREVLGDTIKTLMCVNPVLRVHAYVSFSMFEWFVLCDPLFNKRLCSSAFELPCEVIQCIQYFIHNNMFRNHFRHNPLFKSISFTNFLYNQLALEFLRRDVLLRTFVIEMLNRFISRCITKSDYGNWVEMLLELCIRYCNESNSRNRGIQLVIDSLKKIDSWCKSSLNQRVPDSFKIDTFEGTDIITDPYDPIIKGMLNEFILENLEFFRYETLQINESIQGAVV